MESSLVIPYTYYKSVENDQLKNRILNNSNNNMFIMIKMKDHVWDSGTKCNFNQINLLYDKHKYFSYNMILFRTVLQSKSINLYLFLEN